MFLCEKAPDPAKETLATRSASGQQKLAKHHAYRPSLHNVLERILHYNQNMPELFLEHYTHIQPPVCKHLQPGNMLLQALVESHIQKNMHSGKACQTSLHDVLECILHYNQNMPEIFLGHYTHIQPPVCKHLQPGNMLLQALVESHIQKNMHSGKACQTSLHDVPELFLEHYTHIQPPVCKHLQPGNMLLQALVESHIQKNMHSGKACQTSLHDVPELFLEHYTHIQPPVCKHLQPGNMLLQALVESHIQKNMHSGKACQTSLHDVPELFLEHYTHIQPPVCKHLQPGNMLLQALVESHIQKNMHSGKACQTSLHDVPELFLEHYTHIQPPVCKHLQPGNMLLQALVESHIQKNMHSGKACQTSLHDVLECILHYNQNMPELFLEHYTHIQPPVCKHLQPGNMLLQALVESHIQKNMHSGKACQTSLHDVLECILHYNQNMPELFLEHYTHIQPPVCKHLQPGNMFLQALVEQKQYNQMHPLSPL